MTIEAVIFDLDGTLVNFNLDYKALRAEVRDYLIRQGVPTSVLDVNESIFGMMQKTEIFFKNSNKSEQKFKTVRSTSLKIAEKYEMDAATSTNLLSGAFETLKELKKLKIKIGLCTTSSQTAANYILNRFKIIDFFEVVIPREKVKKIKPDTEQFNLALKTLKINPESTLIVGDSTVDMESAQELKATAIGLPTGLSTKEQLISHGANFIITALTDLPVLINKLNRV